MSGPYQKMEDEDQFIELKENKATKAARPSQLKGRRSSKRRQSSLGRPSALVNTHTDGILSEQQYMLLGILDRYSKVEGETASFLRRVPFLVICYEGILQGHIDYDYAPASIFFDQTFWQVNVSQQFITDLDDLVIFQYIKAIKLTTKYHTSGMAYQILDKGKALLSDGFKGDEDSSPMTQVEILAKVDAFTMVECQAPDRTILMKRHVVEFVSGEGFYRLAAGMVHEIRAPDAESAEASDMLDKEEADCLCFRRYSPDGKPGARYWKPILSDFTDTEDVSYVTSPWIPDVHYDNKAASVAQFQNASNAARATEVAGGQSTVKDDLEELITLDNVKMLVTEWIPFGANQIFALNDKLGSAERIKGGLFLADVDTEPTRSIYKMANDNNLTKVSLVDHQMDRFITFIADIQYPEDEGIQQIEEFGVSCRQYGGCYYGMQIEAIMNNDVNSISVDLLSRVLVDVMDDSSQLMGSLLSVYQTGLLKVVFNNSPDKRSKYTVFTCDGFKFPMAEDTKMETIEGLMHTLETDKNYENELKQIIGDPIWRKAFDKGRGIVIGQTGLLYVGPAEKVSDILSMYACVRGMNLFHQAFYRRLFTLTDQMTTLREDIGKAFEDPNAGTRLRTQHGVAVDVNIKLTQIREFLCEALDQLNDILKEMANGIESDTDTDDARATLWTTLKLHETVEDVRSRVTDMSKNCSAIHDELAELFNGIENIEQIRQFTIQEAIEENTKNLEDAAKASERGSRALEIMQIILAGNLSFDILDRYSQENPMDPDNPVMWFLLSMGMFFLTALTLVNYSQRAAAAADKVLMMKFKINRVVDPMKMQKFVESRDPDAEAYETMQTKNDIRKICWGESDAAAWKIPGRQASIPDMVLLYDHNFGFLFQVYMTVMKVDNMMTDKEYYACFENQLREEGVIFHEAETGREASMIKLIDEEIEEAAEKMSQLNEGGEVESQPDEESGK